jgi:hypothetical protein
VSPEVDLGAVGLRDRAVQQAVASLPAGVGDVEILVEAAAVEAINACLRVAGTELRDPVGAEGPGSVRQATLRLAWSRYVAGPGRTVLRFGDILDEQAGDVDAAILAYEQRTAASRQALSGVRA